MKNFIFDVDGTLIQSEAMYGHALAAVLKEYHYNLDLQEFHRVFGIKMADELAVLGIQKHAPEILAKWLQILPQYTYLIQVIPGIVDLLKYLKKCGVHLAIASSKTLDEYKVSVERLALVNYFDVTVLASDVAAGKPAPDMINLAMERLDCQKDDTIYIGDVVTDLQAAHNAQVNFGAAAWLPVNKNQFCEAEYIFKQPSDILQVI